MILGLLVCAIALMVGFLDWVSLRKTSRRILALEYLGFAGIVAITVFPGRLNDLAHLMGIGRGVDMTLLYDDYALNQGIDDAFFHAKPVAEGR